MITQVARMLAGGPPLWLAEGSCPKLPESVGAVVQTSGSTGQARLVVLSREALLAAAAATRQRQGRDLTWHLALPERYVAGLMVVVRSLTAGRPVPDAGRDLRQLAATGQGDAIALVPTQLHRAVECPEVLARLREFDLVLLGGAPLAPELRERAERAGVPVVTSYGMTETCGGVLWDGVPLPRIEVELRDSRVALRGPVLFEGYLGQPEASALALQQGWLLTNDRGRWLEGRLEILGRVDDVIISGGVNIDLTQVRAAATSIDPHCAVLAVPDSEWGQRVVLVAAAGELSWWREKLATQLPRTWLPRQVVSAQVPRTLGGKPDRAALEALITG